MGFTIVELLIALFLTALVSTAIYSVYNIYYKQSTIQDMVLEAQQNARVAVNLMEREMMNAGYAAGTADMIPGATGSSVRFIYTDPSTDSSMSATAGNRLEVEYALATVAGVQYLTRKMDNLTTSTTGSTEQVIPYVNAFTVTYYDVNGTELSLPFADQDARNTIRFITINIVTETKNNIPGTSSKKTYMLETHIRLRNIGIGQTAVDTTAPGAPSATQVRDPALCASLKVKWTANTEGDIAGYKIYYGVAAGNYTGVINIPLTVLSSSTYSCSSSGGSFECTIFPTAPALDYSASDGSSTTQYYIAVKAYDNSLNHSVYSTEVNGNPDPSYSDFAAGSDDSTINPVKPSAVAFTSVVDGASDGHVSLTWSASASTDIAGYRIYRSTSAFTSYPITSSPIADEDDLDSSATTYTDTGPGLLGCNIYYYAIAPVNCDATLVIDGGGDADEDKYIQTDYDATCGDGTNACTPGSGFAAITGEDTAPPDNASTSAPSPFTTRAGWKRVAVSFAQPTDTDLKQTCIYGVQSSSYPTLLTTLDGYGCYDAGTGIRLYESDGVFTTAEVAIGTTETFWHNSMTALTSLPSLLETGTYSYSAIAFDLCGNASGVTDAQATTTLCGEDPAGKPPEVTALTASSCGGNPEAVTLSWTEVPSSIGSPSSSSNPWDLAGYRIFRAASDDMAGWGAAALLNPSAPLWGGIYSDTSTAAGGTYYYRVVSTDCPYERGDDTGGTEPTTTQIRNHMNSGFLSYERYGPVYPGGIVRDEKTNITQDDHREVLTGVTVDYSVANGDGTSTPSSELAHDTVTFFLSNTSAGTMTITGASLSWVDSSADLREIKVGGGSSSTTSVAAAASVASVSTPYTRAASGVTLTSTAQIAAGARHVPITFTFLDSSGDAVDMREDQLLMTLDVQNDATGTTTCSTFLTVSEASEGVSVPFGPSVTATQQDQPAAPTFGYAVPGSTGLNTVPSGSDSSVVVDSGVDVDISASIAANTTDPTSGLKVSVSSASLFFVTTANTVTTAPTSGFTEVVMTNTAGSIWTGTILENDGLRVWYYVLGIDADGNYDRDPEIDDGAYVYDQRSFDACDVTPEVPTALAATDSGANVTLAWTVPSTYANGVAINDSDTIKYTVYRGGSQLATNLSGTPYSDTGLADGVYYYTVRAYNSCSTPNVSSDSNIAAVCVGMSSGSFTISATPASIYQGGSYTVNLVDCGAVQSGFETSQQIINETAGFLNFTNVSSSAGGSLSAANSKMTETGNATGTFSITIDTTSDSLDTTKLLVATTDTITTQYDPTGSAPQSATVSVIIDPCTNTPDAPANLSGSVLGQTITLTWNEVTTNTDASAIADLANYRVYEKVCANGKPDCTGADIQIDWFLRSTIAAGTETVALSADQGNVSQRIYYFKVTAIDSCSTPVESADSNEWNE
jgi:Tfp pilus assembly protein PilE